MAESDYYEYSRIHSTSESDLLKNIDRETHLKVLKPRMLSGHLQGGLLKMLCSMINAKKIMEIGTYTAYATICMAESTDKNAQIHTIENNIELEDIILKNINDSNYSNKIKLHIGNALDIIPKLDNDFDLVFIDADKDNYINYFDLVIDKTNKNGFIIADNVLWGGKVLDEPHPNDKETIGIKKFNDYIQNDERVENLLLPFRDGLMIMRKA